MERHLAALATHPPPPGAPSTPVAEVMKRSLITVTPEAPVLMALHLMKQNRIGCLPVKQGEHLVAILTAEDLLDMAPGVLAPGAAPPAAPSEER